MKSIREFEEFSEKIKINDLKNKNNILYNTTNNDGFIFYKIDNNLNYINFLIIFIIIILKCYCILVLENLKTKHYLEMVF